MIRLGLALAVCLAIWTGPASAALKITATTGMIADTARNVGGGLVEVTALMGPGVDPHLYRPSQGDLRKLTGAALVFYNGLHLEGRMGEVLERVGRRVKVVRVTETIPEELLIEPGDYAGQYDPHVWMDPHLWRYAVERIRDALAEADPLNAAAYEAQAEAYLKELEDTAAHLKTRMEAIPEGTRILVTAHDAFEYFSRRYDIEVVSLQGISTEAEFGLRDIERLVNILVENNVRAVFTESSISPKSIEALVEGARARGHEVTIGAELYSDAMGEPGTPQGAYLGMLRHNVEAIVEALTA